MGQVNTQDLFNLAIRRYEFPNYDDIAVAIGKALVQAGDLVQLYDHHAF